MRSGTLARILAAAFVVTGWAGAASAAQSAAIFPFEVFDTSGEPPQPDLNERLALATGVLSEALAKQDVIRPLTSDHSAPRLRQLRHVTNVEIAFCLSHARPAQPWRSCP
jgi:hypothetical protein